MKISIIQQMIIPRTVMVAMLLFGFILAGCEDAPPTDYVPQYVVEGYLIVDQPIRNIKIAISQSVTDTFRYSSSAVSDADIRVIANGMTYPLIYKADERIGDYYYPDTTVLVEPSTLYSLEVRTKDGELLTAQTLTPGRVSWTQAPRDTVSVPAITDPAYLKPPDSLDLGWTEVPNTPEFLIRVRSFDTLEYGKYLIPPTDQKNQRVNVELDDQIQVRYDDVSRWFFAAGTGTPTVWAAFKWHGRQEVSIYAVDRNFANWFKMSYWSGNPQYDPLLSNIKGGDGVGVFASASVATKDVFVRMTGR